MNVSNVALPDSIPQSILASADSLVTKTAFLAGMVAPATSVCLSNLWMGSDANYSRIIDGYHTEPDVLKNALISANEQSTQVKVPELRRRIVAAIAHHFHLLQTVAFSGAVARVTFLQQLAQLGLHPDLWSLARGLAHRRQEYQALVLAHRTRVNEPTGAVQPSGRSMLSFAFMLEVCLGEVDYMTATLNRCRLREAVMHVFRTNSRLTDAGIRPQIAPALLALLIQGALPRTEFKTFTGLQPSEACDQLKKMIELGIVVSSESNRHTLQIGLPAWFAQDIFADLSLA